MFRLTSIKTDFCGLSVLDLRDRPTGRVSSFFWKTEDTILLTSKLPVSVCITTPPTFPHLNGRTVKIGKSLILQNKGRGSQIAITDKLNTEPPSKLSSKIENMQIFVFYSLLVLVLFSRISYSSRVGPWVRRLPDSFILIAHVPPCGPLFWLPAKGYPSHQM